MWILRPELYDLNGPEKYNIGNLLFENLELHLKDVQDRFWQKGKHPF